VGRGQGMRGPGAHRVEPEGDGGWV
jgi:hypothetical protein